MKKKFLMLFLVLALALTAAGAAVSAYAEEAPGAPAEQSAPAETPSEEQTPQHPAVQPRGEGQHAACVTVNGSGKITVPADAVQITFRLRVLSDSFKEGRQRIAEMKTALLDAVKGVCEAKSDNAPYRDSHRPVSDGNIGGYEFISVVCLKIADTSKTADAINAAAEAGAMHMYTAYLLENESEALRQALSAAMDDAAAKASALLGGEGTLLRLTEECGWHSPAEDEGMVTVYANVRAKYAAAAQQ